MTEALFDTTVNPINSSAQPRSTINEERPKSCFSSTYLGVYVGSIGSKVQGPAKEWAGSARASISVFLLICVGLARERDLVPILVRQ